MPEERVIIDTGPLVAFLVKEETHHQWVVEQFQRLPAPFLTCEAVLTEAFFLVRKLPQGTAKFFTLLNSGLLDIDFSIIAGRGCFGKASSTIRNVPMSLADACLVRLAKLHPQTAGVHLGPGLSDLPPRRAPADSTSHAVAWKSRGGSSSSPITFPQWQKLWLFAFAQAGDEAFRRLTLEFAIWNRFRRWRADGSVPRIGTFIRFDPPSFCCREPC